MVTDFLYPEDASALQVRTVRPTGLLGFLVRLLPITIEEVVPDSDGNKTTRQPNSDRSIDIDKGWHGLHFLFTGTADVGDEPACYFLRGGKDLCEEGRVRALGPDQVLRFAAFLDTLTPEELASRYDPSRMTELDIYPAGLWNQPSARGETQLGWLIECCAAVRQFVRKAAAAGDGLIIEIS